MLLGYLYSWVLHLPLQQCPHRGQKQGHILPPCAVPHQADAPDLPGEGAKAAGDFDIVFVEQALADFEIVHAVGDDGSGQRGGAEGVGGAGRGAEGFQPGPQLFGGGAVPGVDVFQPFFLHQGQGFAHGVVHVDWGGVVVDAFATAPVRVEGLQVKIPVRHFGFPGAEGITRAGAEGDWGEARWGGEGFLGAGVGHVHIPSIYFNGDAGPGGDGVKDAEGAVFVRGLCNFLDAGLEDAGGGFAVDEGDEFVFFLLQGGFDFSGVKGFAPGFFEAIYVAGVAGGHVVHAFAKVADDADEDMIVRFDEVAEGRFHPRTARAGDGDGKVVFGAEGVTEQGFDIVHHFLEIGIEMTDGGHGEGSQHAGVNHAGARAEEGALWGIEGGKGGQGRLL